METFDIFCDRLVLFVAICFILWQFGVFRGHLLYFPHFGTLYPENLATQQRSLLVSPTKIL
jgi:hypothetical protein